MRKINKGDKVVIVSDYSKDKLEPTLAIVESSGKKWITVRFIDDDRLFPYFFDVQNSYHGYLCGGEKDGSYQVFKLYDYDTVEDYEYAMKLEAKKKELSEQITKTIENYYKIPIEILLDIKNKVEQYNKED